ncbi:hypothetical protein RR46_07639 [Papilio xuthus]|uniref:Uncharacterized protein n=1 Tax=Papilio xuthus TaxID=66420 RepID=A0A194Q723_PAPXU|nr:hypothetical protein RR46_07639 [Papilio xuthus]
MISGGWVCALHVRTAGLAGAALGSDEEEIVYLAYIVIDVHTNQSITFCYGHNDKAFLLSQLAIFLKLIAFIYSKTWISDF